MLLLGFGWLASPFLTMLLVGHSWPLARVIARHQRLFRVIGVVAGIGLCLGILKMQDGIAWAAMYWIFAPVLGLAVWSVHPPEWRRHDEQASPPPPPGDDDEPDEPTRPDGPPFDWTEFERSFRAYTRENGRKGNRDRELIPA